MSMRISISLSTVTDLEPQASFYMVLSSMAMLPLK